MLEPDYNIAKVAGSTIGVPRSEEFKNKLSELRKENVHTEETKLLMSQTRLGANNSRDCELIWNLRSKLTQQSLFWGILEPKAPGDLKKFGKKHTDQTKELIRLSKVGKVLDIKRKKCNFCF